MTPRLPVVQNDAEDWEEVGDFQDRHAVGISPAGGLNDESDAHAGSTNPTSGLDNEPWAERSEASKASPDRTAPRGG